MEAEGKKITLRLPGKVHGALLFNHWHSKNQLFIG